jgi:hypothetical protein
MKASFAAGIITRKGMIEIHFGVRASWLALTPDLARELAAALIERANKIDGGASGR